MRAYIATTPFIVLLASTIALLIVGDETTGTSVLLGRVCICASILCLLCVPAVSKKSLALGYAALLFPFAAFAILTISTKPKVTVTVTEKSAFTWSKGPMGVDEFLKSIEAQKKKPNQQLEPTPVVVTPAADAAAAPTTGVAHH